MFSPDQYFQSALEWLTWNTLDSFSSPVLISTSCSSGRVCFAWCAAADSANVLLGVSPWVDTDQEKCTMDKSKTWVRCQHQHDTKCEDGMKPNDSAFILFPCFFGKNQCPEATKVTISRHWSWSFTWWRTGLFGSVWRLCCTADSFTEVLPKHVWTFPFGTHQSLRCILTETQKAKSCSIYRYALRSVRTANSLTDAALFGLKLNCRRKAKGTNLYCNPVLHVLTEYKLCTSTVWFFLWTVKKIETENQENMTLSECGTVSTITFFEPNKQQYTYPSASSGCGEVLDRADCLADAVLTFAAASSASLPWESATGTPPNNRCLAASSDTALTGAAASASLLSSSRPPAAARNKQYLESSVSDQILMSRHSSESLLFCLFPEHVQFL